MTSFTRETGDFCWINMITPKPAEARRFFSQLLGWSFSEMQGVNGHVIEVDGRQVGGMFDLDDPNTPKGTPPMIGVMVKVASADETGQRATALGGTARPPMDIFDVGRMVMCADPTGAQLDLWEPKKLLGTDVDPRHHGAPSWFEELTPDVDRATAFYSRLFGWSVEPAKNAPIRYLLLKRGEVPIAGVMHGDRAGWITYFTVDDIERAARTADELVASRCTPLTTVDGFGRFLTVVSPGGVAFGLLEHARG
jgi:hypothetical protein